MKAARFVIADVFSATKFAGNQLAVFLDGQDLAPATLQLIAREMNYSETTFLFPPEADGDYKVRIFTPGRELPFAGHPVVGTAFVIAAEGLKPAHPPVTPLALETGVGTIRVEVSVKDAIPGRTTMSQPLPVIKATAAESFATSMALAVGISPDEILTTGLPVQAIYNGITVLIVPVRSLAALQSLRPDPTRVGSLAETYGVETVLLFSRETVHPASTVHCRVFAPGAGVGEDPATGSANGPLGYYLVVHKQIERQRVTRIVSEQGIEMQRPSLLFIDIELDAAMETITGVRVGGDVVISGRGEIFP